jgi:hypothetical protein
MRKITKEACDALMGGRDFKKANMSVLDGCMYLHGNKIAKIVVDENGLPHLWVTTAGWTSNTTKERLNGLPGVHVTQKDFRFYLNGKMWNGEWTEV